MSIKDEIEEKILKGCGKKTYNGYEGSVCGKYSEKHALVKAIKPRSIVYFKGEDTIRERWYCGSCQAKLAQHKETKQKMIEEFKEISLIQQYQKQHEKDIKLIMEIKEETKQKMIEDEIKFWHKQNQLTIPIYMFERIRKLRELKSSLEKEKGK